jgi:hypothetical protein
LYKRLLEIADRQATPSSVQGSQQSTVEDIVIDVSTDMSNTPVSLYEPTKRTPDTIKADLELLTAYLVKERVPKLVQAAISRVQDTYSRRVVQPNQNSTEQVIRQLQATVQQLVSKVENIPNNLTRPGPGLYTEAAKLGLPIYTQQSLNTIYIILQKPVPARYKQEIIVVQGTELPEEKARSYKKLLEQLNSLGNTGDAIAICRLPTSNIILTIEDKPACTTWLKDTK